MRWAAAESRVVFTNDLDFGALLAMSGVAGPSVIQVRALDLVPEAIGAEVLAVLRAQADALTSGALVTLDETKPVYACSRSVEPLPSRSDQPRVTPLSS